ncbi:MAG: hypothetical protein A2Y25_00175 [Candidatus Melainabacteria bacterium GWF2_37_15]|nr:MAG: hypothetical protein A2Y25_00175 [Candidatus Melainabacteria bacterium GWF2_37_15]
MHITKQIKTILKTNPTLFTTSGDLADFSEFQGLDNLQNPTGPILKSLQRTADIYGSKASFYLVNGSSSGIIALMLATVKQGDKVLIARNAHKSVINALILSGAVPVWAETGWDNDWNIPTCANIQNIPDNVKAIWLTSPTYEGIATDIRSIAQLCKEKNIPLIVDEAHGALWPFSEFLPESAIHCGADVCVQSLHKTGGCMNQGALLHLSKDSKINPELIQQTLNIINTTSPSYILLSSIETSIEYLNSTKGRKKLNQLINNINDMKTRLKASTDAIFLENSDPTKIFFRIPGTSAQELSDFIEDNFNIEFEMNNDRGILAITGIDTSAQSLKKLEKAINKAHEKLKKGNKQADIMPFITPIMMLTPSQAFSQKSESVEPANAVGLISRETIVNYPPGIPLIIAGEVVQEAHLEFLKHREKIEIIKH